MVSVSQISLTLEKYEGPDIFELAPILNQISDDIVKVRWTHTKDELRALVKYPTLKFELKIADPQVFDRATATFGKHLKIPQNVTERARIVLTDAQAYDWRKYTEEAKNTNIRYTLLQLCANAIRRGKQPALAQVLGPIFLNGASPSDADVLLRLKSRFIKG